MKLSLHYTQRQEPAGPIAIRRSSGQLSPGDEGLDRSRGTLASLPIATRTAFYCGHRFTEASDWPCYTHAASRQRAGNRPFVGPRAGGVVPVAQGSRVLEAGSFTGGAERRST